MLSRAKKLNDIALRARTSVMILLTLQLRDVTCHIGSQRYVLPLDTSERAPSSPSQTGWYSINLPQTDGKLSRPRWSVSYRNGLSVSRQSPIQLVTGPGVD